MDLLQAASLPRLSFLCKLDNSCPFSFGVSSQIPDWGHAVNRSCFHRSSLSSSKAATTFHQGAHARPLSCFKPAPFASKAAGLENVPIQASQEVKLEKPVIVIDNYDSFTYNLVQYMGSLGCPLEVYRNDELTIEELNMKEPSGILISPGPGTPQDSGISLETVVKLGPYIPLFGVCMGLQCMGEAFGGKIVRSPLGVMHGKKSLVYYDEHGEDGLLAGLPNPFVAGRYHSLVIDKENFPSDELEVTAWTEDGLVMGVRHKRYRLVQGVQFHPESIITENGMKIIENFLNIVVKRAHKH